MPKEILIGKKALCAIVQETKQKQQDAASKTSTQAVKHSQQQHTQSTMTAKKSQFNIIDFKESIRQRLKEKRVQQRREEEEEAEMDEEYHGVKESSGEENDENSRGSFSSATAAPPVSEQGSKDSDEDDGDDSEEKTSDEENENDDDRVDSDSSRGDDDDDEFKLGMDDEEDDQDNNDEATLSRKKKKQSSSGSGGRKVIESDSDESDRSFTSTKSKAKSDYIPPTIPSNQLTNSKLKPTTLDEAIYASQLNEINKRRSLDELTNISFNCDALNTSINSNRDHGGGVGANTNASSNNPLNVSQNLTDTTINNDQEEEEGLFDELAFLCSGQFKSGNTQKKTQPNEAKKDSSLIAMNDNDLYAADDDDDDGVQVDENKKKPPTVLEEMEDEATNSSLSSIKSSEKKELDENSNTMDKEEEEEEEKKVVKKKEKRVREESDDDEELDTDKEEAEIDEVHDETESNDKEYLEKKLRKEGFLEEEAELSGSEAESDEDYDGDPDEDEKGLLFSGDEAELPSDNELKDELGKIYLKDQRDKDLREMRMLKERFLTDGEFHSKNSRKKQFRWKNLDNMKTHCDSSDEDEDEDEEGDDNTTTEKTDDGGEKAQNKSSNKKKTFKPIGDWRSNRHEREKFVLDKMKSAVTLLSDEENENSNSQSDEFSISNSTTMTTTTTTGGLMKKGQELIRKQSVIGKTQPTKRPSSFITSNDDTSSFKSTAALFGSMTVSKSSTIPTMMTRKDETSSPASASKKYSFLNGDKSYLTRLSNYVNKNCNTASGGVKTTTGVGGGVRNNNMVFMSRQQHDDNHQSDEENNDSAHDNNKNSFRSTSTFKNTFATKSATNTTSTSASSSSSVSVPDPKRVKLDKQQSVFSHFS